MAEITINPQEAAEKWQRNMKNSTPDIQRGVNAVTESPMDKAVAAQDKMVNRWNEAINSGKWAANTSAVSTQDWKSATLGKGMQRLAAGVDNAVPKVVAFMGRLLPFEQNLQNQVRNMPDTTFEDSEQRMLAWSRGMRNFQNS